MESLDKKSFFHFGNHSKNLDKILINKYKKEANEMNINSNQRWVSE